MSYFNANFIKKHITFKLKKLKIIILSKIEKMSSSKVLKEKEKSIDHRFTISEKDKGKFYDTNTWKKLLSKNNKNNNNDEEENTDNDIEIEEEVEEISLSSEKENSFAEIEKEKNQNKNLVESESINEIIDDAISENLEDDKNLEDNTLDKYKEKIKRSGVIYISYIPEGMTVSILRRNLEKFGVNRIYLVPDLNSGKSKKRQNYKEGWIEFKDKLMAKLCEYELNGKILGGKKRNNKFREEIWNLKYLNKFKWHHLMEKLQFNKKLREHRMNAELSQIKRENNFIVEKFELSRKINYLNKKRVKFLLI